MKFLITLQFLVFFALTQQVTHIHLDDYNTDSADCKTCTLLVGEDVTLSTELQVNQIAPSHIVTREKQDIGPDFSIRQSARSPPVNL
jgi:hypothetical protein